MARWPTGAKAVQFLLDRGKLEGLGDACLGAATEDLLARATGGEGSHMTVEDAVGAQFADRVAGFAKPTFERLRRTRHLAAEPPDRFVE